MGLSTKPQSVDTAEANAALTYTANGELSPEEISATEVVKTKTNNELVSCKVDVINELVRKLQVGEEAKVLISKIFDKFCSITDTLLGLTDANGNISTEKVIKQIETLPEWQGILAMISKDDQFFIELAGSNLPLSDKLKFIEENKKTKPADLRKSFETFMDNHKPETKTIPPTQKAKQITSEIFLRYKALFTENYSFEEVKSQIKAEVQQKILAIGQKLKQQRERTKTEKMGIKVPKTVNEIIDQAKSKQETSLNKVGTQITNTFSLSGEPKVISKEEGAFDINLADFEHGINDKTDIDQYTQAFLVQTLQKIDSYMENIKGKRPDDLREATKLSVDEKQNYLDTIPKWAIDGGLAEGYVKYITEKDEKGDPKNPHKSFHEYLRENLKISGLGLMFMQLMSMLKDVLPQLKGKANERKTSLENARTKLKTMMGISLPKTPSRGEIANDMAKQFASLMENPNWANVKIVDLYAQDNKGKVSIDNRENSLAKDKMGMKVMNEILNAKEDSLLAIARTKGLKWATMRKIVENKDQFKTDEKGVVKVRNRDVKWNDDFIEKVLKEEEAGTTIDEATKPIKVSDKTTDGKTPKPSEGSTKERNNLKEKYKDLHPHISNLIDAGVGEDELKIIEAIMNKEKDSFFSKTVSLNETSILIDPDGDLFKNRVSFKYADLKKDKSTFESFKTLLNRVKEEELSKDEIASLSPIKTEKKSEPTVITKDSSSDKKELKVAPSPKKENRSPLPKSINTSELPQKIENPSLGLFKKVINQLQSIARSEKDKPRNKKTVYFGKGALKITDKEGSQHYFHYSKPEEFKSDEFKKAIVSIGIKMPIEKVVTIPSNETGNAQKVKPWIRLDFLRLPGKNPYLKYSDEQLMAEADKLNNPKTQLSKGVDRSLRQQQLAEVYISRHKSELAKLSPFRKLEKLKELTALFYRGKPMDPAAETAIVDTYGYAKVDPDSSNYGKNLENNLNKIPEDEICKNIVKNSRGINILVAGLFPNSVIS